MVQARMEGFKKVRPSAEDLNRVIEKDDSNSSVTTDREGTGVRSQRQCLDQAARIIDTNKFQISVVCAVAVDGFLVVAGLLAAGDGLTTAAHGLHYTTIGMLCMFVAEVVIRVVVLRRQFFRRHMEIFDAVVVIVTLTLAIVFANDESVRSCAGLLILLRLWRVAKILNGIIQSVRVLADRRLQHERRSRAAIEQELAKFRVYCQAQEREITTLRGILRKHCLTVGDDGVAARAAVAAATISVVAEVNSSADMTAPEQLDMSTCEPVA